MEQNYNNIDSNLKKLVSNKQRFKVPKGYFETVEDIVFARLQAEALNKNIEQKIPEGYFDNLEEKVTSKLENNTKVISLRTRLARRIIPIAAAASIISFFSLNSFFTSENKLDFNSIASEEIENYFNTVDFNEYEIAEVYNDQTFDTETLELNIDNQELENYLDTKNLENLYYDEL